MTTLSALRSTFAGDPADFESALSTLSGVSSDLATIADSFSSATNVDAPATNNMGSSVVLNGPISIYGVQDVESLYDQLTAEAKRRNV